MPNLQKGSKVRIIFIFEEDDGTPIPLASVTTMRVKIKKGGSNEEFEAPLVPVAGETNQASWTGTVDTAGRWKGQGYADEYLSKPVAWVVDDNPVSWP